jgi:hypothetical protein
MGVLQAGVAGRPAEFERRPLAAVVALNGTYMGQLGGRLGPAMLLGRLLQRRIHEDSIVGRVIGMQLPIRACGSRVLRFRRCFQFPQGPL